MYDNFKKQIEKLNERQKYRLKNESMVRIVAAKAAQGYGEPGSDEYMKAYEAATKAIDEIDIQDPDQQIKKKYEGRKVENKKQKGLRYQKAGDMERINERKKILVLL